MRKYIHTSTSSRILNQSFVRYLIDSLIGSLIYSPMHSFNQTFIHSVIHPSVHSCIRSYFHPSRWLRGRTASRITVIDLPSHHPCATLSSCRRAHRANRAPGRQHSPHAPVLEWEPNRACRWGTHTRVVEFAVAVATAHPD